MGKYTPGPWVYDEKFNRIISTKEWFVEPGDLDGIHTTIIETFGAMGGDETRADINLICAAPELLEACKMAQGVLLQLDNYEDYTMRTLNDLAAAIDKAEGVTL